MQFCDVIFCNRYYAWYHDFGQTQLISKQVERELRDWFDNHGKPVVQAEYGADTVAGMHAVRAYNIDVMSPHMEKMGAYHLAKQTVRKFRSKVKWNSNFPEKSARKLYTTSTSSPLCPFGTERRKFLIIC